MKFLYIAGESADWSIKISNKLCEMGHHIILGIQRQDMYESQTFHENLKVFDFTESLDEDIIGVVKQFNPDIALISHINVIPWFENLNTQLKIKRVHMILDIPSDLMSSDKRRMDTWEQIFSLSRKAQGVIVNTTAARDELFRYTNIELPEENLITYATELPDKYKMSGVYKDGGYVLSISRLSKIKNNILIPKALSLMKGKRKYVCVGRDNGQLKEIAELCKTYGIEFIHKSELSTDEKFKLIEDCSVLVYPQNSKYIGGLAPFEGLFVGKPVIVPDEQIYRDLYKEHAIYFDNDDHFDLACAIAMATELKPIFEIKQDGSDYAEKEAGLKTMAEKIEIVLQGASYD